MKHYRDWYTVKKMFSSVKEKKVTNREAYDTDV
jgi:hypothetical protein